MSLAFAEISDLTSTLAYTAIANSRRSTRVYAGRLSELDQLVWYASVGLSLVTSFLLLARWLIEGRGRHLALVLVTIVSIVAVLLTLSAFTWGGSHPTAQLSSGESWNARRTWSAAWPFLSLGAFASVVFGLGIPLGRRDVRRDPLCLIAALFAASANALTLRCVWLNFPDA